MADNLINDIEGKNSSSCLDLSTRFSTNTNFQQQGGFSA